MKRERVSSSFSRAFLRSVLLFAILVVGDRGIFSEENTNPVSILEEVSYEKGSSGINAKIQNICVFNPFTYHQEQDLFHTAATLIRFRLKNLKIMGSGKSSPFMMAKFLESHNPKISKAKALKIAHIYIQEAGKEGVNYDVAFSQMCLETGFLRYGGSVKPQQNNFCGLGVTDGSHGLSFPSIRIGIRAHIQHLKAYASEARIEHPIVDARLQFVKRGSIKTIAGLSGKWASDKNYSGKICLLMSGLYRERRN